MAAYLCEGNLSTFIGKDPLTVQRLLHEVLGEPMRQEPTCNQSTAARLLERIIFQRR
jgi:hypothetical protein